MRPSEARNSPSHNHQSGSRRTKPCICMDLDASRRSTHKQGVIMECSEQILGELHQIRIILSVSLGVLSALFGLSFVRAILRR